MDLEKKIEILTAIILTGLVFKEYEENYNIGIKELEIFVKDFFDNNEMVFYKGIDDLSEKILKICKDDKLRRSIGKKGKDKYLKYFSFFYFLFSFVTW